MEILENNTTKTGSLAELRYTSHVIVTKILILFNSEPTQGTGGDCYFKQVLKVNHATSIMLNSIKVKCSGLTFEHFKRLDCSAQIKQVAN